MFLGKLIIAAATAFIFYLFVTYVTSIHNGYTEPLWQVALVFIIAYLISMLFMSVYGVAMDALLQCFIVDETNQKGKGKAKWAPADLADLMDTENE